MIFIGADHGGYELKEKIKTYLGSLGCQFEDLGNKKFEDKDDFPDYAKLVAEKVIATQEKGILICGSGIGMSIAANKIKGIRAALCCNEEMAKLARAHNDANILCLGGRLLQEDMAKKITQKFIETGFEGAERLVRRNDKIKQIQ